MRSVGPLLGIACALFLSPAPLPAAPADDSTPENPYAQTDPDGVPLSVSPWTRHAPTAAQIGSARTSATATNSDRNWLVSEYERQELEHANADPTKETSINFYLQLSLNKDLAKLAGIQPIDSSSPQAGSTATPHPDAQNSQNPAAAGSRATAPLLAPLNSPGSLVTAPATTPWSSAASISSPGFLLPSKLSSDPSALTPAPEHSTAFMETTDLQTPGMVASKDDPADAPEPALDALPGESGDQARVREEANSKPDLTLPMDEDALHQEQDSKLKVPAPASSNPVVAAKNTTTAPKAIPVNPADAPISVKQMQEITPVHAPNSDPYDILNR